ncbi:EamA family transporter [Bacillus marinisedimentorum]|uniref:EamA family transporter n=1 Tax=Bacillus marinisedimentorum TaxID=1821260 RepID=UPI000872432A|nr:DMT family transporter [Bacillus marinisedimentorum]
MKTKGVVLVLIGAASFGFTPIFVKTGFGYGYSLGQINITQMLTATALLWMFTFLKGLDVSGINVKNVMKTALTGTSVGLTSIFYYGAMKYLPASLAIILLFQFVWIGMVYEWIFSKARPDRINYISMAVTLTGVFFASNILGGEVFELPAAGLLLGLLSGVSYAGFIFSSGRVAAGTHPLIRSALMVSGSAILVLIIFFQDIPDIRFSDGRLWLIGTGIALVGAVIPPLFFAAGTPLISGRLANMLSSIELPVAIITAMVFLSESVSGRQWAGITLIVAAILINELGSPILSPKRKR